jgi:hypothetical protein
MALFQAVRALSPQIVAAPDVHGVTMTPDSRLFSL